MKKEKVFFWGFTRSEWEVIVNGGASAYGLDQEVVDAVERRRIAFLSRW